MGRENIGSIADIRCPSCGAPAYFDISTQRYQCDYCGGKVSISEALEQKRGFRELHQQTMKGKKDDFGLQKAVCTGCGAEIVFAEGEAVTDCAFCGRKLVRKKYLHTGELPELIIPFRITEDEAKNLLLDWCRRHPLKRESRHIRENIDSLSGYYLPYELVRGPVECRAYRMDRGGMFECRGYVDNVFVNTSRQLNNLMLNGMEPYELDDMKEMDFAYVAGHRVKVPDIPDNVLKGRVRDEISESYRPAVCETLQTKSVHIHANEDNVLRMPALLPAYFISSGDIMTAVNGQTGKVSVQAEKDHHRIFLPWWIKAILATIVISAVFFGIFMVTGMERGENLCITGMLAFLTLIITLTAYSDSEKNDFIVNLGRRIYTSRGGPYRREGSGLVQDSRELVTEVMRPVFHMELEGKDSPVVLRFATFARIALIAGLSAGVLLFPVILALFVNGFKFSQIVLGGSAVWFCIFVPTVPIYVLKFGIMELYDRPWIYTLDNDGSRKRYRPVRKKEEKEKKSFGEVVSMILGCLFVPPVSLITWGILISMAVMVYLTAGYGWD